jgi:hypothetical protein
VDRIVRHQLLLLASSSRWPDYASPRCSPSDSTTQAGSIDGAEIIGYDPEREGYASQYFGSEGPTAYENRLTEQDGATVWEMQSEMTRFRGVFSEDGGIIDGHWQLLGGDAGWRPWMNITLTKQGG